MHIRKIVAVAAVTLCCAGFAAVPVMAGQPGDTDGYAVNAAAGSAALITVSNNLILRIPTLILLISPGT